jgi:hypothetical protein
MLPPKALFLWGAHSLRIYHHQIITNFFWSYQMELIYELIIDAGE